MSKRYYTKRKGDSPKDYERENRRNSNPIIGSLSSLVSDVVNVHNSNSTANGYVTKPHGMDLPLPNHDQVESAYSLFGGDDTYMGAISRLGHESSKGGSFLSSLLALMDNYKWPEELRTLFIQSALQQAMTNDQRVWDRTLTQEQRDYDWYLKQDQRNFDSPTNQLARFMGAGISREAALSMLSGGSSGAGVAGSAPIVSPAQSVGSAPGTAGALSTQRNLGIANSVFEGINTIANMVSMGVSVPQSIEQTKALQMQNSMSQKTLQGWQSADSVLSSLQNAVTSGAISQSDMDGFSNATDALNYIMDHKDSNAFKPVFQNGTFQNVYGTKTGREMFTNAWNAVRQSKDAGTLLDQHIAQQLAASELSQLDIKKGYTDLQYAVGELSRQDVEIQKLWNDVWQGNYEIQIAGKELEIKTNEASRSNTEQDIYDTVMNGRYDGAPDARNLGTGASFLAYSAWSELYLQFNKAFAMNGTPDRRESWERFFLDNQDAAKLLAGIKLTQAQIQSNASNPDLNPFTATLFSLYTLAQFTGAYDVLSVANQQANAFMPYLLTPNKPK